MRRAAKVDANHAAIVKALRARGWFVQSLAAVGQGVPDLLVARRGVLALVEVKDGDKPPSARKLTDDEALWHRTIRTIGGYRVHILESLEDVERFDDPT